MNILDSIKKHLPSTQKNQGFTIVELLTVIVVIAILATIVIVSYNGITRSATIAALKSDLRNTEGVIKLKHSKSGVYPENLTSGEIAASAGNVLTYQYRQLSYCLSATTKKANGPSFKIGPSGRIEEGSCIAKWSHIAAGSGYVLAVTDGGDLYSWGSNSYGQLGNGTTTNSTAPALIPSSQFGGKRVTDVFIANNSSSFAITEVGQVYAWGRNTDWNLGDGTTIDRPSPVLIHPSLFGNASIKSISGTQSATQALTTDGQVYAWGSNSLGQVGDNTYIARTTPVLLPASTFGNEKITSTTANTSYTLALTENGNVYSWGTGNFGGLGTGAGTAKAPMLIPRSSFNNTALIAVSTGQVHSLAISADGNLYSWGDNSIGQLGDGTTTSRWQPVLIDKSRFGNTPAVNILAVHNSTYVTTQDGSIYGVGQKHDIASTGSALNPVKINPSLFDNKPVKQLAGATSNGRYAITSDGLLYAYGSPNGSGGNASPDAAFIVPNPQNN